MSPPVGLAFLADAFSWCNARRPWWGMSGVPGRIPTAEIVAWLTLRQIEDPWMRRYVAHAVDEVDRLYVERMCEIRGAEHRAQEMKAKGPQVAPRIR